MNSRIRSRVLPAVLFGCLMLLLQACGGGGGGGGTTGSTGGTSTGGTTGGTTGTTTGGSTGTVASAISSLNSLIRGSSAATFSQLQAVRTQFVNAQAAEPNSVDGHTGRAIVEASLAARRMLDLFGSNLTQDDILNLTSPMLQTASVTTLEALAAGRFLPKSALIDNDKLIGLYPFMGQTDRLSEDDPTPWEIAAVLNEIKPYVDQAVTELTGVAFDQADTVIADATPDGSETGATATAGFGLVERKALLGQMRAFAAMINLITAYSYDLGSFNPNALATTAYSAQFANDDTVAPSFYAPGGSFLRLRADGPTRLSHARERWQDGSDLAAAALGDYLVRPSGDHIIPDGSVAAGTAQSAKDEIEQMRSLFTEQQVSQNVPLADGLQDVVINYAALIDSPPQDLKVFFPSLILSIVDGAYAVDVDSNATIDLTFGGVFPSGLSDLAFYLRGLFGITTTDTGDIVVFAINIFG